MSTKQSFLIILIAVFTLSCTTQRLTNTNDNNNGMFVFTQDIRERLEENDINLKQVQFYIGSTVILERTVASNDAEVTSGQVILDNGVYKNRVVIPKYTPGIFTETDAENYLYISFEENNSLRFHNYFNRGEYVFSPNIMGDEWDEYYVNYAGDRYDVRLGRVRKSEGKNSSSDNKDNIRYINDDGIVYLNKINDEDYFISEDEPFEIKLVLKKTEFDQFDLETRTLEGLRVQ